MILVSAEDREEKIREKKKNKQKNIL